MHKNNLDSIPFLSAGGDYTSAPFVLDSVALHTVYQDTINHSWGTETGNGNNFYGYIDTFKNFNMVCMYTGMGDGGDDYELLTFTKAGKRIAYIEAAWLQGEEDEWNYNKTATVAGYNVNVQITACHVTDTTTWACDTINRLYRFKDNGEIVLVKSDSVLRPELDSIRRAIPYN